MGLSTASLLLPVFMARELLGIKAETLLGDVLDSYVYLAWLFLGLSILFGVFFLYLSAKWIRTAYGQQAGIFWSNNAKETTIELCMEISFWSSILLFGVGLVLTIVTFFS